MAKTLSSASLNTNRIYWYYAMCWSLCDNCQIIENKWWLDNESSNIKLSNFDFLGLDAWLTKGWFGLNFLFSWARRLAITTFRFFASQSNIMKWGFVLKKLMFPSDEVSFGNLSLLGNRF